MKEKEPANTTEQISMRTDKTRKNAMARIMLWRDFVDDHPDIDLDVDEDLTEEQAAKWYALLEKQFPSKDV